MMKKTGGRKSRWTFPLRSTVCDAYVFSGSARVLEDMCGVLRVFLVVLPGCFKICVVWCVCF